MRYLIELSVACAMLTLPAAPASAQESPFRFQEATIAGIHAAFAAGQLTCTQLTKLYLDRIACERQAAGLQAGCPSDGDF